MRSSDRLRSPLRCAGSRRRTPAWFATIAAICIVALGLPAAAQTMKIASYQNDGGPYYVFAQELIAYLDAEGPASFSLENLETQGSVENIQQIYGDPEVVLAICQEDVVHFFRTGNNEFFFVDRTADTKITALGRLLLEEVYVVARSSVRTLDDIDRLYVGEPRSGTFATYTSLRRYHAARWEEVQEGDRLEMFRNGEIDALIDVSSTPHEELLRFAESDDDIRMLPIDRNDLSLGLDVYQSRVVPDSLSPDGTSFQTVSVPAILLARRDLPAVVSQAILRIFYDEDVRREYFPQSLPHFEALPSDLRESDNTPLGTDVRFSELPIPPHPSVVRLTLGKFPYLGFAIAFFLALLIWLAWYLLPRRNQRMRQVLWGTPTHRDLYRDVHFLMLVLTWGFGSAWAIKALEIGELASGRTVEGTAFVHMSFGQLLKWLLVVVTLGIEELSFPSSPLAQIFAVSVQVLGFAIVGWVGARVISTLVSKISERRTMKSFSSLSKHVLILNWNMHGTRLLEELRSKDIPDAKRKRRIVVLAHQPAKPIPVHDFDGVDHIDAEPWDHNALKRVAPQQAESVIILSPSICGADADMCDGLVYRTALSLRTYLHALAEPEGADPKPVSTLHVAAQASRPITEVARHALGIDEVVSSHEMGGRLLAQTVTCPGITGFFKEILESKSGSNEVYQCDLPAELRGKPADFWSVIEYYSATSRGESPVLPIGIRVAPRRTAANGGNPAITKVLLNPTVEELHQCHADEFDARDKILLLADNMKAAAAVGG